MMQSPTSPARHVAHDLSHAHGGVDIPQPAPDVVPLPPSPHPVPPAPDVPPEIKEPPSVDTPPIREPGTVGDPVRTALH